MRASGLVGLAVVLVLSGSALAGEPHHGPPQGSGMVAHIADELGLDSATKAKVQSIFEAAETKAKGILLDARQAGRDLKAERDAAQPDLKKMEKLIHRLADLRADVAIVRLHAEADIDALLTPDQRTKLRALREEHRDHGGPDEDDLGAEP